MKSGNSTRVSWQSVALFAIAAAFFGVLGWLKQDAIIVISGTAVSFFMWILQGPVKKSTGHSMFPPGVPVKGPPMVSIVAAEEAPSLVPEKKE